MYVQCIIYSYNIIISHFKGTASAITQLECTECMYIPSMFDKVHCAALMFDSAPCCILDYIVWKGKDLVDGTR